MVGLPAYIPEIDAKIVIRSFCSVTTAFNLERESSDTVKVKLRKAIIVDWLIDFDNFFFFSEKITLDHSSKYFL